MGLVKKKRIFALFLVGHFVFCIKRTDFIVSWFCFLSQFTSAMGLVKKKGFCTVFSGTFRVLHKTDWFYCFLILFSFTIYISNGFSREKKGFLHCFSGIFHVLHKMDWLCCFLILFPFTVYIRALAAVDLIICVSLLGMGFVRCGDCGYLSPASRYWGKIYEVCWATFRPSRTDNHVENSSRSWPKFLLLNAAWRVACLLSHRNLKVQLHCSLRSTKEKLIRFHFHTKGFVYLPIANAGQMSNLFITMTMVRPRNVTDFERK